MIWVVVLVLAVGTIVLKTVGPLAVGGVEPPEALARVIDLLTPALLASLVVASTFTSEGRLILDERSAGVAVGLVLLMLRTPLLITLLVAAVITAGLRLLA